MINFRVKIVTRESYSMKVKSNSDFISHFFQQNVNLLVLYLNFFMIFKVKMTYFYEFFYCMDHFCGIIVRVYIYNNDKFS